MVINGIDVDIWFYNINILVEVNCIHILVVVNYIN